MVERSVLATRLTPPGVGAHVVHRAGLVRRLQDGFAGRLSVVTGGAGFGKTTLVADAARLGPLPVAWVSCDAGITSAGVLARHLVAALAGALPGFGAASAVPEDPAGAASAVVNELAALAPDRLVLVLDDLHTLAPGAADVVPLLVAHLPEAVHLVLVSRERTPVPLGRLRLGGVVEIGEPDLALTPQEVAEMLRLRGLDPARADRIHARTEGWPAAAVLLAHPGARGDGALAATEPLLEYLAEEVLTVVGDRGRHLLDATALCGRVTERMATHLTGDPQAGSTLGRLADGSVLVTRLMGQGGWFRFHALLREFQESRIRDLDAGPLRELRRRTAAAWLLEGDVPSAVPHLLAAGDHAQAADALVPVAHALAGGDRAGELRGWLEGLPAEVVDARPALVAAHGTALFGAHRFDAAFDRLSAAVSGFAAAGDPASAAATLFRLLEVLQTTGEFTRGIAVCEAALPGLEGGDPLLEAALRLRLAGFLGDVGRAAEAAAILDEIEASDAAAVAPVLVRYARFVRAWAVDHPRGRTRHAIAETTRVADAMEGDPDGDPLRLLPWVYALRGVMHFAMLDRPGMARDIARFTELAPRYGIEAVAEPIVTRGHMGELLLAGRLEELDAEMGRWHEHFVAWREVGWNYHYLPIAAGASVRLGRIPQAVESLRLLAETLPERAPLIDQARVAPDGALLAHLAGEPGLAATLASQGLSAAERTGAPWALVHANAVAAVIAGETADGATHLARAIAASEGEGAADAWCHIDRVLAPDLLAAAMRAGIGSGDVTVRMAAACGGEVVTRMAALLADAPPAARVLLARAAADAGVSAGVVEGLLRDRDAGVRAAARAAWSQRLRRPRARVAITSLGSLTLAREGRPIDPASVTRQKSLALLAALLAAGGRASRDLLCEWLWPELAPDRAAAALRSTLHDLRRVIEPEVDAGAPHALLRGDGDAVALVLADGDTWDVAAFRAHVAAAAAADGPEERIGALTAAERCWGGAFLADWEAEDWTAAPRRALAAELADVRVRLAAELVAVGRAADAVPRLRVLCEAEPEREEWHRRLMAAYRDAGERGLALRQYHVLRAALRRAQGVPPAAGTEGLYRDLLRAEGL